MRNISSNPWRRGLRLVGALVIVGAGLAACSSTKATTSTPVVGALRHAVFVNPIAISAKGRYVWVGDELGGPNGTGSITKINAATSASTVIISPLIVRPEALASDGTDVWAVNQAFESRSASVVRVNVASGQVTRVASGSFGAGETITSDGKDVWVVNESFGSLTKIDVASGAVSRVRSAAFADPNSITSDGNNVWVANASGGPLNRGSLAKIDINTGATTKIDSPRFNGGNTLTFDTSDVWELASPHVVLRVDKTTNKVTTISNSLFASIGGIATNGVFLWLGGNYDGGAAGSGSIAQFDIATGVVTTISSPRLRFAFAMAAAGDAVWVTSTSAGPNVPARVSKIVP